MVTVQSHRPAGQSPAPLPQLPNGFESLQGPASGNNSSKRTAQNLSNLQAVQCSQGSTGRATLIRWFALLRLPIAAMTAIVLLLTLVRKLGLLGRRCVTQLDFDAEH